MRVLTCSLHVGLVYHKYKLPRFSIKKQIHLPGSLFSKLQLVENSETTTRKTLSCQVFIEQNSLGWLNNRRLSCTEALEVLEFCLADLWRACVARLRHLLKKTVLKKNSIHCNMNMNITQYAWLSESLNKNPAIRERVGEWFWKTRTWDIFAL